MKRALIGAVVALALAAFDAQAATCDRADATHSDAAVTGADAGEAQVNVAATEASRAWEAYEASVESAMRAGSRPREWALAATSFDKESFLRDCDGEHPNPGLDRAVAAAPDDAFVQWLAVNNVGSDAKESQARVASAMANLKRIEPDNAAVWMLDMSEATRRDDNAAVDESLARMAESKRFDDHFIDTVHAWIDAYDSHPPTTQLPALPGQPQDARFESAFARAAATALPAYQTIVTTCKPTSSREPDAYRQTRCETTGRLMLDRGTTLIARSIGFAVLRNLGDGVLTDEDNAADRNLDWYRANVLKGTGYEDGDAFAMRAHEADWRDADDEIEVMKNALRRAGLPTEPPADWNDTRSQVAAAR